MTVKKQHAPDLVAGAAIRDGKGRIIDQTYALKTEIIAGTTNVTEGTFEEIPVEANEGDIHILTAPYTDFDYTEGLIDPKLERVKYHTGTEFVKGENSWNRISNTGNNVNEWDYKIKTFYTPSTGVVKIARIALYSNITFRVIYNVPAPAKETASCTISFKGGSAIGTTDNKSAVSNLCFYKQGATNYLCIKPTGNAVITLDLYDVKFYKGSITPIEPVALTTQQIEDITEFTEIGQSKEIVIDPTDTDNVLTLGLRKANQSDNEAYLDFNANSGIQNIDIEKGYYHILNTTEFNQTAFYWNGKTCYHSGGSYTTPVEVSDIDSVRLDLDYIEPGTYYFVNTKPINTSLTITSRRNIATVINNTLEDSIPANTTIGFTITEDSIAFFKKGGTSYITSINGIEPDENGNVDLSDEYVTTGSKVQYISGLKAFANLVIPSPGGGRLYFGTLNPLVSTTPHFYGENSSDDDNKVVLNNAKLELSRSGIIDLGNKFAIDGDTIYRYVIDNLVTLDTDQNIQGTKNFNNVEVKNAITFNTGLNTQPIGSITVNNNNLKVVDSKLELSESGNIANGDNFAVTANEVATYLNSKLKLIEITEDGFNFANSSNFPALDEVKQYIVANEITVINGPTTTLNPGVLIKMYRTTAYDNEAQYVEQYVITGGDPTKHIYTRRITFYNNQWSAENWDEMLSSVNLSDVNQKSIMQIHAGNTYGAGFDTYYNILLGGDNQLSNSKGSFVVGQQNIVNNDYCVVGGNNNNVENHKYVIIAGQGNKTKNNGASVFGTYADTKNDSYFTIGNGSNNGNIVRSNLFDVKTNGDIIIKYNGEDTILQSIIGSGVDESTLVHKAGYEIITGEKVFNAPTNFKDLIYLYNENKTTSIAIKYVKNNNTDAIEIGLNNTNVKGKTGLIASGDLYFVTGGTVYAALQSYQTKSLVTSLNNPTNTSYPSALCVKNALDGKATDTAVVHIQNSETIYGTKTFSNNIIIDDGGGTPHLSFKKGSTTKTISFTTGTYSNNFTIDGGVIATTSGSITDGESRLVTGDVVYDALQTKATDSDVVHKATNETITGIKTFTDYIVITKGSSLAPFLQFNYDNYSVDLSVGYANNNPLFYVSCGIVPTVSGTIASGDTKVVTGGVVYTALTNKADDSEVVHLTGAESITGKKTFVNTGIPISLKRSSDATIDLSILVDGDNNPNIRRYDNSSVSQNVLLKSDRIEFRNNLTTVNAYVNSNSNLNQDWTTNQLPTKNAVNSKILEEIGKSTDIVLIDTSFIGTGYYDIELTEHHRITYLNVTATNTVHIQVLTSLAVTGDIIIVDGACCNNGGECLKPVKDINDTDYHYLPLAKNLQITFATANSDTVYTKALIKWYYDGTDWICIERIISGGVKNTY